MNNTSKIIQSLLDCISIPSPTPPNDVEAMSDWVEAWGHRIGARVERQRVEQHKDNVLLTLSFGPGPRLLFNTHMDVNDPTGQSWSFPPFCPFLEGGRVWGRGAADAKGSLVAMLAAMEQLSAHNADLKGELVLSAVMGEEAGGLGSLYLVNQGFVADAAVVGEPTDLRVMTAHKGTYMRRLRFHGRSAHSGRPELGVNAVTHAAAFSLAYDRLNSDLAARSRPIVGAPTATVTVFEGGTRQNTVPDRAELIIDRRLIPGETHANADDELTALLLALQGEWPALNVDPPEVIVSTTPSETPVDATIVRCAIAAVEEVTGVSTAPEGFSAGSDMGKLVTIAHIPSLICGPGSLAQAHAPDEFVDAGQVEQAETIYAEIARRFLGKQDESCR